MTKRGKAKTVGFNYGGGEERTEKVAVAGYAPFTVTFRVPRGSAVVNLVLDAVGGESGKPGDLADGGQAMINFIARHLVRWSLPEQAGLKAVEAIDDGAVLFALWRVIHEAGQAAKN